MAKQTSTQLTGSAKQIAWAESIRRETTDQFEADMEDVDALAESERWIPHLETLRTKMAEATSAGQWIESRPGYEGFTQHLITRYEDRATISRISRYDRAVYKATVQELVMISRAADKLGAIRDGRQARAIAARIRSEGA